MKYVCEVTKIAAMNDLDRKTVCSILLSERGNCSYWFSCDWDGKYTLNLNIKGCKGK